MWAVAPANTQSAGGKGPEAALVDTHAPWCAIWTHSHCEQLVNGQLSARGFESSAHHDGTADRRLRQASCAARLRKLPALHRLAR
jgi:hypothetical protein